MNKVSDTSIREYEGDEAAGVLPEPHLTASQPTHETLSLHQLPTNS